MKRHLDEKQLLYVATRKEWRTWLKRHYQSANEVWLVYYKKHTGRPRLAYHDAVEEALCFGWIDSTVKRLDADRFAQRFSVRRPQSPYSQVNRERLRALLRQGKVAKELVASMGARVEQEFEIAPDIVAALQANPAAWQHYQGFSAAYMRIRIAYIEGARKRPAEFAKRLRYFIARTAQGKQFGVGGIEKYY
jgi:uncharacterized protein YdeI (YjbR/CyaY-like superfamily)